MAPQIQPQPWAPANGQIQTIVPPRPPANGQSIVPPGPLPLGKYNPLCPLGPCHWANTIHCAPWAPAIGQIQSIVPPRPLLMDNPLCPLGPCQWTIHCAPWAPATVPDHCTNTNHLQPQVTCEFVTSNSSTCYEDILPSSLQRRDRSHKSKVMLKLRWVILFQG